MELIKKANGQNYKFASEKLILSFIELCKKANTDESLIREMLEGLENSKIEQVNQSCSEA